MIIYNKRVIKLLLLSGVVLILGCNKTQEIKKDQDYLFIYSPKEVKSYKQEYYETVPVIDKLIPVKKDLSIEQKIKLLCKTLSEEYFSGLRIEVKKIDSTIDGNILHIELLENEGFDGPKGNESSWYNYFQGSTGGMCTTIILEETLLQRNYKGDWIDAVIFYYEGEGMGGWDHVMLEGELARY